MLSDEDRQLIYEQMAAAKENTAAINRVATGQDVKNALLVTISEDAARLLEQLPTFIENYQALANSQASTDEKLEDLHVWFLSAAFSSRRISIAPKSLIFWFS